MLLEKNNNNNNNDKEFGVLCRRDGYKQLILQQAVLPNKKKNRKMSF